MNVTDRAFRSMIGTPCWGVQWDAQLGLSLNFGTPKLHIREPFASSAVSPRLQRHSRYRNISVRGTWWLWAWCGLWRLRLADDDETFGPPSSKRRRNEALGLLDGQRLLAAGVDSVDGSTELLFDRGACLRLWDSVSDDREIWALYKPNRRVLVVRADGLYSDEKGTQNERWRRLP